MGLITDGPSGLWDPSDHATLAPSRRACYSPNVPDANYDNLIARLKRTDTLRSVLGLLGWDEQVNLPPDSAERRAQQLQEIAAVHHAAAADPQIGRLLAAIEARSLPTGSDEAIVARYARRDFDRASRLPEDFVREKASLDSAAFHAWARARKASDFSAFAPFLERQIAMARREAELMGWAERPYDYAIDRHDPGLDAAFIAPLFDSLRRELPPLARRIAEARRAPRPDMFRGFPVPAQREFIREVLGRLGFNWNRGRLDISLHPFCGGDGLDTRLTTRFDENNPLDAIFSSIHEAGHALYEQGLPAADIGTPLGDAVGMAVHESQSRLWENQVGRSAPFWAFFEPRLRDLFGPQLAGVSREDLLAAINEVRPGPIRVDADEVTYNLHILMRFEMERALFDGRLAIDDLPSEWNRLSEEIVGVTPEDDARGVLQDIHWSGGAFGYFPSYALGNMIAAQLWYHALDRLPGLADDFARGDFSRLLSWLRENIHRRGKRLDTRELVVAVTGQPLGTGALLRHLAERYLPHAP